MESQQNVCRILSKLGTGVLCKNYRASVGFVKISSVTALYFAEQMNPWPQTYVEITRVTAPV